MESGRGGASGARAGVRGRALARAGGVTGVAGSGTGAALLLHGRGGSGAAFGGRVAGSALGERLGLGEGGTRAWRAPDGPTSLDDGGFAWWAFPPGVSRSYEADEWLGSGDALAVAEEAGRGCELCVGFSQGGMLLAVLLASGRLPDCRVAVVAGAGWPRPYAATLRGFRERGRRPVGGSLRTPAILHVTSPADAINPPVQAREVHACLGGDVLEHASGHVMPLEGPDAAALARWTALRLAE